MKPLLPYLAIANFVFVIGMIFGPHEFVFPAVFTAIFLFVDGVSHVNNTYKFIGGMFNFLGVVAGGLSDNQALEYMAILAVFFFSLGAPARFLKKRKRVSDASEPALPMKRPDIQLVDESFIYRCRALFIGIYLNFVVLCNMLYTTKHHKEIL